jgi:dihydrofolate reductase
MKRRRKIIAYIAISADGYIARPNGDVTWLDRPRPKGQYGIEAFFQNRRYDSVGAKDLHQERRDGHEGRRIWAEG